MGATLAIIYVVGLLASMAVLRGRAGLPILSVLSIGTMLTSLPWGFTTACKVLIWPAVLVFWLVTGRPESPWRAVRGRHGGVRVQRIGSGGS